jgi:hypothetical protein
MSLDSGVLIGAPRLRVLGADLVTVLATYYLPFPDKDGGIQVIDTQALAIKQPLLNGAIRYISGGIRHNVNLNYGFYDPVYFSKQTGKVIGNLDGQVPELTQLYTIITSNNNGNLAISPCSNQEIWYRSICSSDLNRETIYPLAFGKVSIQFEGLDLYANSSALTPIG